ncbi:MAG: hypothetical protein Kow0080_23020 [Candidatus Promineifilaceae bacterium]
MEICIPYQPSSSGGPSTFYRNLTRSLQARGVIVTAVPTPRTTALLAIIYAHPRLLLRAKRLGIPIIQRLDGVHYPAASGWKSIRYNLPIWLNYRLFSRHIIFQSQYSRRQCLHFLGPHRAAEHIIYNGVDTAVFTPANQPPTNTILSLLSSYKRAFELETVIQTYDILHGRYPHLQLAVAGQVSPRLATLVNGRPDIHWLGTVPHDQLPAQYRQSLLLLSAKLRQNCPNAVLEAMASGVPTVCFDSGAHLELIGSEAGHCVPLPNDSFGPFPPLNAHQLADAAESVLANRAQFSQQARLRAVQHFSLGKMVSQYWDVLQGIKD